MQPAVFTSQTTTDGPPRRAQKIPPHSRDDRAPAGRSRGNAFLRSAPRARRHRAATYRALLACGLQLKIADTSCPLRIFERAAISRCFIPSGRSAARAFSSLETSSRKRAASSVPDPVSETWHVRRSVLSRTRATSVRASARSISPERLDFSRLSTSPSSAIPTGPRASTPSSWACCGVRP